MVRRNLHYKVFHDSEFRFSYDLAVGASLDRTCSQVDYEIDAADYHSWKDALVRAYGLGEKEDSILYINREQRRLCFHVCGSKRQFSVPLKYENDVITPAVEDYWQHVDSGIFRVYHPSTSIIRNLEKQWLEECEIAMGKVCDALDVSWNHGLISFIVFDDYDHGKRYGLTLNFTLYASKAVYVTAGGPVVHEIAHLVPFYAANKNIVKSLFLREGFSSLMSFKGYHVPKNITEKLFPIEAEDLLLDQFVHDQKRYHASASFVEFLLQEYGMPKFKKAFFQVAKGERELFKHFFGDSYECVFRRWKQRLERVRR